MSPGDFSPIETPKQTEKSDSIGMINEVENESSSEITASEDENAIQNICLFRQEIRQCCDLELEEGSNKYFKSRALELLRNYEVNLS